MFRKQNVYGLVTAFNVRVKDEREQDRNHLVEVNLELPLDYDLADEIMPAMARDLFFEAAGQWTPKTEMTESAFALDPHLQLMELRTHPELAAECRIPGVGLRRIKATKSDGGTWILKFTATWTLGDPKEAILMIQRLKQGVYLTFEEQEPTLPIEQPEQPADPVASAKNVTTITSKPKRKKKGGSPEEEAQRQLTEGQKKLGAGEAPAEAVTDPPAEAAASDDPPAEGPGEPV